ncbi:MAG: antitoxin [Gammaproteobacteria bacterium]|nr:MAG: antitoxin [Gammaproteobacteria bacterium]
MRTTIDIDDPVLRALRKLQKRSGKPLGRLVSDLLAQALGAQPPPAAELPFTWVSRPMAPLVDLADKEALYRALEEHS